MSVRFDHQQNVFHMDVSGPSIPPNSLSPGFDFHFIFKGNSEFCIRNPSFEVLLKEGGSYFFIGMMILRDHAIKISEYGDPIQGYLPLTFHILNEIEKRRENRDVIITFRGKFNVVLESEYGQYSKYTQVNVDHRIPKSDWVETWLPALKYKDVSLVELPKLLGVETANISENLNSAWKNKQMGQYNATLTHCRLAIDELRKLVQKNGFINEDRESRDKTDWKEFFHSDSIGEIFDKIETQIHRFTSRGVHTGRSINLQDADLAMLTTHACVNFVLKELFSEK